jgi:hypothetical protein
MKSDKPSKEVNAFVVPFVSTNAALKAISSCQRKITCIFQSDNCLANMETDTTYALKQQPKEDQPGSGMSLSESTGRVLPDDREPGAQSEDLRNGGVEHAIPASRFRRFPHAGCLHLTNRI